MRFKQRRSEPTIRKNAKRRGGILRRVNTLEVLEGRVMLAGNTAAVLAPWHNPLVAQDVNHDGRVSPIDALLVIDDLKLRGPHSLTIASAAPQGATALSSAKTSSVNYLDVNGDNMVSPSDLLQVVSRLAIPAITQPLIVTTVIKDMTGNLITTPIQIGTQFQVETDVFDNRSPVAVLPGVFSTYLNFSYDQSVASIDNPGVQVPVAGANFAIFGSGSGAKPLDVSTLNQITDEGAFSVGANPPAPIIETLFTFTATATNSGTETFTPFFDSILNHDSLLFGNITPLTAGDVFFVPGSVQIVAVPSLTLSSPGPSINEANVGTTPFVFTVTLSQAAATAVTVQFATADGTAKAFPDPQNDYLATSGTLTFAPTGPLTKLVTVLVNADPNVEGPETFSLVLSNPSSNVVLAPLHASVGTILNTSVSTADVTVSNTLAGANAVFTISLSTAPTVAVTVGYAVTPDTAHLGVDYGSPASGTVGLLAFSPTVTTQFLTVPIIGDALPDTAEQFHVTLAGPTNAILGNGQVFQTVTGTILPAVLIPSVSITPLVSHPDVNPTTDFVFTATLSSAVNSESLLVFYTTADGSGPNGATHLPPDVDYFATSGTLTFTPGQTSLPITVQVPGNAISEPNESFTVNLTPVSTDVTGTPVGTGLILSEKGTPTVSISSPTVIASASGFTNALFTVSLNFPVSKVVTVPYATQDNTAHQNTDYLPQSGQLTFTPSDSSLFQVITVPVIGIPSAEADETFFLNLSPPSPSDGAVLGNQIATATIVRQGLVISDMSASQGTNAVFTVTLTRAQDHVVTVFYSTADGTDPITGATVADSDYLATSGTLTFATNQTTQSITVTLLPDSRTEPNETFFVNLSNPTGSVQILSGQATGTILNNQGQKAVVRIALTDTSGNLFPPTKVLSLNEHFLLEAFVQDSQPVPTGVFQSYLNAIYDSRLVGITSGGTISYGPGFNNGHSGDLSTAGQVNDAGAIQIGQPPAGLRGLPQLLFSVPLTATNFGLANFSVGPSSQPLHDLEEFVINSVANSDVNFVNSATSPLSINIGNNVFSVNNVSHVIGPTGTQTPFVFTVTRFLPNGTTGTIVVSTSDGTAHAPPNGNDYVALTSTTLTFSGTGTSESQLVTVLVNGNTTVSPDETFFVNLTAPTNAQASTAAGIGTIQNAFPPKISITGDTKSEGDLLTFTVSLNAPSSQTATVAYTTASPATGNIATPNVNYTPTSGVLTFLPGITQRTISVQSLYVNAQTVDETFQVVLSNPVQAALAITPDLATGTIKVIPSAKISGTVYADLNNNGRIDGTEIGIPNVTVTAIRNEDNHATTTLTNASGVFSFPTLQPGTYTIKETQPGFFIDGLDTFQGTVSPTNDQFSNIAANSGIPVSGFLFGEQGLRATFAAAFQNRRAYFASSIVTGILGSQMNPSAIDLRKGDVWVSFDGGLAGLNVIQAFFQASQGSVTMTLFDNSLIGSVATSTATPFGAQITYTGVAGSAYFLHITGTNPSVSLQVIGSGTSPSSQPAAAPAAAPLVSAFAPVVAPAAAPAAAPAPAPSAADLALTQSDDWVVDLLVA